MKYINIILALILLCTVFLINKENIGTWIAVLFAAVCLAVFCYMLSEEENKYKKKMKNKNGNKKTTLQRVVFNW